MKSKYKTILKIVDDAFIQYILSNLLYLYHVLFLYIRHRQFFVFLFSLLSSL